MTKKEDRLREREREREREKDRQRQRDRKRAELWGWGALGGGCPTFKKEGFQFQISQGKPEYPGKRKEKKFDAAKNP